MIRVEVMDKSNCNNLSPVRDSRAVVTLVAIVLITVLVSVIVIAIAITIAIAMIRVIARVLVIVIVIVLVMIIHYRKTSVIVVGAQFVVVLTGIARNSDRNIVIDKHGRHRKSSNHSENHADRKANANLYLPRCTGRSKNKSSG